MATNKNDNTIHSIARSRRRCAVMAAVSIIATAHPAHAEAPSTLMANPAGSHSIDLSESARSGQSGTNQTTVGPPVQTPEDTASAPNSESELSKSEVEAASLVSSNASRPLGASASFAVGDVGSEAQADTSGGGWGLRTVLALASVIGLILLCKFAFVRLSSRGSGSIAAQLGPSGRAPSGLLSVLARYPIAKGSTLVLLRLDRRVLLLSQTSQGFTTLAEIDDPEEVAALIMRAEDEEGASLTRRFRTMLAQAERDPGLIGEREYEIETAVPRTSSVATARFHDLVMDAKVTPDLDPDDHSDDHPDGHRDSTVDAVGSLRNRLRSLREVTA